MTRPTERSTTLNQELGITNVMPASAWMDWSGVTTIPGTLAVGRDPLAPTQEELVFMLRRDGQAQAMLKLLTLPIRAAFSQSKWIAPADGGGEEETAFANQMWSLPPNSGGMESPASLFLRQTLLALAHGFSAFEVVRTVATDGPLKGKVVIQKMGYRDPRTVTFLADDHGNYKGFKQVTHFGGRYINVSIKAEDTWYWAVNEEQNPMYGISFFESAFQHYQMKRKLYYIGHLAAQLAAVPGRIGEIPLGSTPKQIADFKTALSNFAFNTAMIAPPNFKVTPFNGNSQFDFVEIIDHHNMMMTTSILAKFLQQEDRQVLIDNGKADASADMFVQMLEALVAELAESWSTKLMPQFIDLNFGSGVYPVFKFAPLTDEIKQAVIQLFETMVSQPTLNATPEFMRNLEMALADRLSFDIDYKEVAKAEQEAAQQQQAAQEAAQKAALQGQAQPQGPGGVKSVSQGPSLQGPLTKPATTGSKSSSAGPIVKASMEQQSGAIDMIYAALSTLIDAEDVPENFAPEGEVIPEAGD